MRFYSSLSDEEIKALDKSWSFWARPAQIEPGKPGSPIQRTDWVTWIPLAGRGWGKTRVGSEFIRSNVCGDTPLSGGDYARIALIAETAADARNVMVEGDSGIMGVHPKDFRPEYEPSKRKLTWPNGAVGYTYNGTEPDQLRGPQHDLSWLDELAKFKYARETWDMNQFGLRLGTRPKQLITTTPRPIPLLREIMADPSTIVTRHATKENSANLPESFFKSIVAKYEGTRLGRQELEAEILDDVPGALWTRDNLDEYRTEEELIPEQQRIVVGVDPAITVDTEYGAETGIICCGLGVDGRGYVLDDASGFYSPDQWARKAIALMDIHEGDAVIVETNQGGDMVENTLRAVRRELNVVRVRASRGKITRAEPIAALFEQGRACMVGSFAQLEDQMMLFTPEGIEGDGSADRVDALVWAMASLFNKITKSTSSRRVSIDNSFNALKW
jgi:phage terminase large subunit-like protein